jgi:hypothetical protein
VDASAFDPFRSELRSLREAVATPRQKLIRDLDLRERFRTLFRIWITNVEPGLRNHLLNRRDLVKLTAEIERLAQLASKNKPVLRISETIAPRDETRRRSYYSSTAY